VLKTEKTIKANKIHEKWKGSSPLKYLNGATSLAIATAACYDRI
jgi:hypothetical protein